MLIFLRPVRLAPKHPFILLHRGNSTLSRAVSRVTESQPSIPAHSQQVKLLRSPQEFYRALLARIRSAKRRILLSSLYIGHEEQELLKALENVLRLKPELQVTIQLDYFRSTRPGPDSPALALLPLLRAYPERVSVYLYRSPTLKGLMAKFVPRRFDEGWGTWHAKIYAIDDAIILSGANLNRSYFVNRQDRYLIFEGNKRLSNYCLGFLRIFSNYSFKLLPSADTEPYALTWSNPEIPYAHFIHTIGEDLASFQSRQRAESRLIGKAPANVHLSPLIQSGPLGIREEEQTLSSLLYKVGHSSSVQVDLTSGYFSLYAPYQQQVFSSSCQWRILAAGPKANGFFGSRGISGRIPHGYTILEQRFWRGVKEADKVAHVNLREWERVDWTYHAKGIWIRPTAEEPPSISVFGSTNLNSRSANLDTELSFVMHTECPELQHELAKEVDQLWTHAHPVDESVWNKPDRVPPLTTRLIVGMVGTML